MDDQNMKTNDHDLLIALNVKFDENGKNMDRLHEKVTKFFGVLDSKADRHEVNALRVDHAKVEGRLKMLEDGHLMSKGEQQGKIKVGEFSIKTWGIISGIIFLAIALIEFLSK